MPRTVVAEFRDLGKSCGTPSSDWQWTGRREGNSLLPKSNADRRKKAVNKYMYVVYRGIVGRAPDS